MHYLPTALLGWAIQILLFIFLSRDWISDKAYLDRILNYFVDCKYPIQLLLFPEGTDLSDYNKDKSLKYAEENNLTKYYYVLHPRTKGFVVCVKNLKRGELKSIVDIDVGYTGPLPQNESDLLQGRWPTEIHFRIRNFTLDELPESEEGLASWLQTRWAEKEKRLEEFYKLGHFQSSKPSETARPFIITLQMLAIILFWSCVVTLGIYSFILSWWCVGYFLLVLFIFWFVDRVFGGFDNLELPSQTEEHYSN